jgi:chromosome segregation ATPase
MLEQEDIKGLVAKVTGALEEGQEAAVKAHHQAYRITELEGHVTQLKERKTNLESQVTNQKNTIEQLRAQKETHKKQIELLEAEKAELDKLAQQITSQRDGELAGAETEIAELKATVEFYDKGKAAELVKSLQFEAVGLESEIKRLREERDEMAQKALDQKTINANEDIRYQGLLRLAKVEVNDANNLARSWKIEADRLDGRLKVVGGNLEDAQGQIKKLKDDASALLSGIDQKNDEIRSLMRDHTRLLEENKQLRGAIRPPGLTDEEQWAAASKWIMSVAAEGVSVADARKFIDSEWPGAKRVALGMKQVLVS